MKSAIEQLSDYKSVHLNATNLKTHFVGIPLIIWSIFLLLSLLRLEIAGLVVGGSVLLLIPVMLYYLLLHWRLAIGMAVFMVPIVASTEWLYHSGDASVWLALLVFAAGWVFQFIGHYYEKAKPAFLDDISQLFIGPFFLMAEIYFMLGWAKSLEHSITPLAKDKRLLLEQTKAVRATN